MLKACSHLKLLRWPIKITALVPQLIMADARPVRMITTILVFVTTTVATLTAATMYPVTTIVAVRTSPRIVPARLARRAQPPAARGTSLLRRSLPFRTCTRPFKRVDPESTGTVHVTQ